MPENAKIPLLPPTWMWLLFAHRLNPILSTEKDSEYVWRNGKFQANFLQGMTLIISYIAVNYHFIAQEISQLTLS